MKAEAQKKRAKLLRSPFIDNNISSCDSSLDDLIVYIIAILRSCREPYSATFYLFCLNFFKHRNSRLHSKIKKSRNCTALSNFCHEIYGHNLFHCIFTVVLMSSMSSIVEGASTNYSTSIIVGFSFHKRRECLREVFVFVVQKTKQVPGEEDNS